MKNFILTTVLTILSTGTMLAQGFNFGAGAQMVFNGSVLGVQGKAIYNVNNSIDAAGTFTLHLEDFIDWTIDLDAHYLLLEIGEEFGFKPFAGLSITRASVSILGFSESDTSVGLNVGAFFDLLKTDKFQFYVEPKIMIGGFDGFAVSGGILF